MVSTEYVLELGYGSDVLREVSMDFGMERVEKRGKLVDILVELVIDSMAVATACMVMVVVATHAVDYSTNRRPIR